MAGEQPKKVTGGAFGRYMAEHRASLLKELPGKPATASIKLGSERFKALSEAEKQKYQKKYEQAKAQYETALAAFKAAGGEMKKIKKKVKKEKKTKDPNRPKKPAGGAYGCYLDKHRAAITKECQGKPVTAVSKLAGERWKSLSASEKVPFEQDYEKKKAAYEAAMKNYVPPAKAAGDDDEDDEDEDEVEQDEDGDEEPAAKKPKTAKKADTDDSAAEAKTLGYARQFTTLMDNDKVKASGASAQKVLDALKVEKGKVVQAKKALLGA
jgi:hypothetical protein